MPEAEPGSPVLDQDRVDPDSSPGPAESGFPSQSTDTAPQTAPLPPIDARGATDPCSLTPRPDLHEDQGRPVAGDQIYLAASRPAVAVEDLQTGHPQPLRRDLLGATADE